MSERNEITRSRTLLLGAFDAALQRVNGRDAVVAELKRNDRARAATHVFAVGKAAASMYLGAREVLGDSIVGGLVLTKHDHEDPALDGDARLRVMTASHPVPDASSLAAGQALLDFVNDAPADARFLALISGGASALVDVLHAGVGEAELAAFNRWLLANGFDIHAMNRLRKRASRIKGGRLAAHLNGRPADVLMISDVSGDDPKSIGSGLLVPHDEADLDASGFDIPDEIAPLLQEPAPLSPRNAFDDVHLYVIACPADARAAATAHLRAAGIEVTEHDVLLEGDAISCGAQLAKKLLDAPPGATVHAGETTVTLPPNPGRGGRCQALALSSADVLAGHDGVVLLAVGTDGTDGPGEDAGAIVDGGTVTRAADGGVDAGNALAAADAGTALAASGDLVTTGATGTNVMDLVIALRVG